MQKLNVTLGDGRTVSCAAGTPVGEMLKHVEPDPDLPFVAACLNNDVVSLTYPVTINCNVRFQTMADPHGWRVYRRTACFLLAKVIEDLFPQADFWVEHSLGRGIYCSFHDSEGNSGGVTQSQLDRVETRMRELVKANIPITRCKIGYEEAVAQFETANQPHKLNLLRHRNPPRVVLHCCEGFYDLAHGPLMPSTELLMRFDLVHYQPGFVLNLPDRTTPKELPAFTDQPHLFHIIQEHKEWGRILDVNTVGRLNEIIAAEDIGPFIRTAEALHEKKISRMADAITTDRERIQLILIAGPSSAGKTTFAKRLTTHLSVNGMQPLTVSTDDYFVGPQRNPLDEDGKPDFEHIEAVDLALFNEHLDRMMQGETVELPYFNFETKQREFRGRTARLGPREFLIIEGIHALNPRLTEAVPVDRKHGIYVSALTQLSVDTNNRISTTDNRLMRRLVRDHLYRGHSPLDTLRMWPSVRRGEKRWVFPFQQQANLAFNSALDYELAVLKPLVEPLLMRVKPGDVEYGEARRLSEFLLNFLGVDDDFVPRNSILREYIGGSEFRY